MSNINAGLSLLSKQGKSSRLQLNDVIKKLGSGSQLEGSAPSVVQFERVNVLNSTSRDIKIKLNGVQARTTWFQISRSYLQVVHDSISEMKELSIKAASSLGNPNDYAIWDQEFQEIKRRVSELVDGFSGQKAPLAAFNSEPLLLNFSPIIDLEGNISTAQAQKDDFNLYTGYQNEAFNELTLLQGEDKLPLNGLATAGSISTLTLGTEGSIEEEKYQGWTVNVLSGTGVGQQATILSYDGANRRATFEEDLAVALDSTSKYVLSPPSPSYVSSKFIGTAEGGSLSTLQLPIEASGVDDVYKGMKVVIRSGAGSRQEAVVESYEADSRTLTFQAPLSVAPDNTSNFVIISDKKNRFIDNTGEENTLQVASYVWGADNYRLGRLNEDVEVFVPITEEEKAYRTANGIPDTVLEPLTDLEKQERRRLNIFDTEFGVISSQQNAMRMLGQLENASNQLSLLITRADAKVGNLNNQHDLLQESLLAQYEGLEIIDDIDTVATMIQSEELILTQEVILPQLMQRITDTYRGLNRLLQNQGKGA